MAGDGKATFAAFKALGVLDFWFSAEKETRLHGWDTPKSAHPCAGSGGDIHVATRSQPCRQVSFSISTSVIDLKKQKIQNLSNGFAGK